MKILLLLSLLVAIATGYPIFAQTHKPTQPTEETSRLGYVIDAAQLRSLLATSDHVVIRGELEKDGKEVTDQNWITAMSREIGRLKLDDGDSCSCCGWKTAYFYRKEVLLGSIATIHGSQVRIRSQIGYGDFKIPDDRWNALDKLFNEKTAANQALVPTTTAVTPAADAPVAPAAVAAHL